MLVVIYSLSAPMSRRRNKPQRLIVADSVDREPGQLHNLFERIFHECLLQKYLLVYKSLSRAYGPNRSYRKKRLAPANDHPSTEAFPESGDTKFQHVEAAELHYTRAVKQFFDWCDERRLELADIEAITLATYI